MPRPSLSVRMKSFSASAGSPKNFVAALIFQHQKLALDGSDGRLADIAIALRGLSDRRRVVSASDFLPAQDDRIQQRAQILHIDQQSARSRPRPGMRR